MVENREEEGEEPAEGDHGEDLETILEELVQFWEVLLCQALKHHCNIYLSCVVTRSTTHT